MSDGSFARLGAKGTEVCHGVAHRMWLFSVELFIRVC